MELILNNYTRKLLDSFIDSPSHALLIIGPNGSGKTAITEWLSKELMIEASESYRSSYVKTVRAQDNKQIGIDEIRLIEKFLVLKAPSSLEINRIVIIENGDMMTPQAQNALLKTLEAPPLSTLIIITAHSLQSLLPTIRSRAQQINIKRPEIDALTQYFLEQKYSKNEIEKALSISGGLPGLSKSLLSGVDHPLMPAIAYAKLILSGDLFKRLLLVDELYGKKDLTMDVLFVLQQMAHYRLSIPESSSQQRWRSVLIGSFNASELYRKNVLPKLVFTDLMLRI